MTSRTEIPFIDRKGIARTRIWPRAIDRASLRILLDDLPDPAQVEPVPIRAISTEAERRSIVSDADSGKRWDLRRKLNNARYHFLAKNEVVHDDHMAICTFAIFWGDQVKTVCERLWGGKVDGARNVCSGIGQDWLESFHLDVFVNGDRPSMLQSMYRIALAGLCPLVWRGSWPDGFCYVYCPSKHPWATSGIPAAWQPSPAARKAGTTKPKPTKPLALAVPKVPVASFAELKRLIAAEKPGKALEAWWSDWAETPACRKVLRTLCAHVRRLECDGRILRIHAADGYGDGERIFEAKAPFAGALKPMPPSAARLIRRHAGLVMLEGQSGRRVLIPPFERGRFQIDFDLWWTSDVWDADEPFRRPALVPCTDGDDVWAYHQLRARLPGEPELRRISHDGGDLEGALPYGAGGVVLRLIAKLVVPQNLRPTHDFGLCSSDERPDDG